MAFFNFDPCSWWLWSRLYIANFRPDWQHGAICYSKTTDRISDFLTPFCRLLELQWICKALGCDCHHFFNINSKLVFIPSHATSHRIRFSQKYNPPLIWISYKSWIMHQNPISTPSTQFWNFNKNRLLWSPCRENLQGSDFLNPWKSICGHPKRSFRAIFTSTF